MRNQTGYDAVFSKRLPVEIWPVLVYVYKQVDAGLAKIASRKKSEERLIRTWRAIVSLVLVAKQLKTFSYTINQLLQIDAGAITDDDVADVWNIIVQVSRKRDHTMKPQKSIVVDCCYEASIKYGLDGKETVGRRDIPFPLSQIEINLQPLSAKFLDMVDALLPSQPWKPGVHIEAASKLKCNINKVSRAIQQLIAEGKRNAQRDGVVYDSQGRAIAVDKDRFSVSVDELNENGNIDAMTQQKSDEP